MNPDLLKYKLTRDLPGIKSHLKMAPSHREEELLAMKGSNFQPRLSAVFIIFFHEDEKLKIVFIRRSEYVGIHSGQIAFPGGRYEDVDKDLVITAYREVEEEIGISASSIELLGQLTDLYVPPSNFLMRTFVGYMKDRPQYRIDTREVQEVLEFDFDSFKSENVIKVMDFQAHAINHVIKAPCYVIDGIVIWGATAMILTELLDIITDESLH